MHKMSFKHLAIIVAALAVGVVVLNSFGLPLASLLPLAFIALCPLMMIVMMMMMDKGHASGHGDHAGHDHVTKQH